MSANAHLGQPALGLLRCREAWVLETRLWTCLQRLTPTGLERY